MTNLQKMIARFTFYLTAGVLLLWTASLTYSFVASALPGMAWFVPALSLIVFDVGMIAWLVVFLWHAEGDGQRSIAILACLGDMVGVGLMALSEILLGGQQLVAAPEMLADYAIWGIAIWTIGNVVAVVWFHLLAPESRKAMALQSEKDAVFDEALKQLTERRQAASGRLASSLSGHMFRQLEDELVGGDEAPARGQQRGEADAPALAQGKQRGQDDALAGLDLADALEDVDVPANDTEALRELGLSPNGLRGDGGDDPL